MFKSKKKLLKNKNLITSSLKLEKLEKINKKEFNKNK